ncbi:MAG: sugar-binding domain-containing protein [Anaerorhabdus sp.]
MRELIPKDQYGVFADTKDTARVDSLFVAEFFEKEHKNVLRDITKITDPKSGLSREFAQLNFEPTSYTDGWNRKQKAYAMTRDGFTMLVMANKLFMSRPTVSRLLKKARLEKVVDVKINYESEDFDALSQSIKKQYPVSKVVVVKTLSNYDATINELGKAAADVIYDLLHDNITVGISWGHSVKKTVDYLSDKRLENTRVVELFGSMGLSDTGDDTFSIGSKLSSIIGGRLYLLPAPIYLENKAYRDALVSNKVIKSTMNVIDECDFIVSGLGAVDSTLSQTLWDDVASENVREVVREKGGVGFYCAHFFDELGQFLPMDFNNNIIGISENKLKSVKSVVVAGGKDKVSAIRSALKGGLIHTLVSDDETLEAVLNKK